MNQGMIFNFLFILWSLNLPFILQYNRSFESSNNHIANNDGDDDSLVITMKGKPIISEKAKKRLQKTDLSEEQVSKKRTRGTKVELTIGDQIYEEKNGQEETKECEAQEEEEIVTQKKRRYSSIPNTRGLSNRKLQVLSDKSNILSDSSSDVHNNIKTSKPISSDSQKFKIQDSNIHSKDIVNENVFQKASKSRRNSLSATSTKRLANRDL